MTCAGEEAMAQQGTVRWGINNIYRVEGSRGEERLCRIKGKILEEKSSSSAPLVPGDRVEFDLQGSEGLILARLKRENQFLRHNLRRREDQTLFANIDQILCIVSVSEPPLKPGFIDRVLLCAGDIPVCIVCNKTDLEQEDETAQILSLYSQLGYKVLGVSAHSGMGIESLHQVLAGKRSAFFGKSGVGKSSLINLLIPGAAQQVGDISRRYQKGRHTTNYSVLLKSSDKSFEVVDSPGVREIEIPYIPPEDAASYYPEFQQLSTSCRFSPCLHLHEPDCAVKQAVHEKVIDQGRYERYRRIVEDLQERKADR